MSEAKYGRLSEADREAISRGLAAGLSSAAIARSIGRVTSTVSREIARNYGRRLNRAGAAARKAHKLMGSRRGGKRKLWANAGLRRYVEMRLAKAWCPDEIARRYLTCYRSRSGRRRLVIGPCLGIGRAT